MNFISTNDGELFDYLRNGKFVKKAMEGEAVPGKTLGGIEVILPGVLVTRLECVVDVTLRPF
jgi:hypothetical protein